MNRRTLLINNLKSELWIQKIMRQHEMKYQPPQTAQGQPNVPTPNQPVAPSRPPEATSPGIQQPPVA